MRRTLLWRLYGSYVLLILVCMASVAWYATKSYGNFYLEHLKGDLEARARLAERQLTKALGTPGGEVDRLCKELGRSSGTRITVVLPSGEVIGDSDEDPARMVNHADRPEIIQALQGKAGESLRDSPTLRKKMLYVAVPMMRDGQIAGAVRASIPVTQISGALGKLDAKMALGVLLILVIAAALSLQISRRISEPLRDMTRGVERFARGELSHRLPATGGEEMRGLAEAMNEMARQLNERIRTVTQQRNEQEAMLASMVEGVVAVDNAERVISMNKAAAEVLDVDAERAKGMSMQEVTRSSALQGFVSRALSEGKPVEADVTLSTGGERSLHLNGTALRDAEGKCMGAVVVLNDVTRLRRLENMRRDFVANVSHELRTPLTSIKGFVETLLGGAMKEPEDAERFLKVVAAQVDRLNAIIEDLLMLSRVEQGTERAEIRLEEGRILDVLKGAIGMCASKAEEKEIRIELDCDEGTAARINPPLLEQAVVNLIDNAIKYSEAGRPVAVSCERTETDVRISVRDEGCGIEKEHLPRLFERFYRVDRARSRKMGGTGLGLAIVKHIAQAHGGRVGAESTPGKGSTFTIYLPPA